MIDVIVIGAGPAGSTAARIVASAGFKVQLVEKRRIGETKVCGGMLSYSLAKRLCPDSIVGRKIGRSLMCFPWGKLEKHVNAAVVDRGAFDGFLAETARNCGAELITETRVTGVKKEHGLMRVHMKNVKDATSSFASCKMVIFADGATTLATITIPGIGFEGDQSKLALAARYEIEWEKHNIDHCEVHFGSDIFSWGYGWIFPREGFVNVGVGCLLSRLKKSQRKIGDTLNCFIRNRGISFEGLADKRPSKIGAALIPLSPARKIFSRSVLVVGDAAGMVDPLLGCGINYAIHAAELAGHTAVKALRNQDFSERALSRYQVLWQQTSAYSQTRKGELITRAMLPFSRIEKNLLAKVEYLFLFGKKSPIRSLKAGIYPVQFRKRKE